MRDLDRYLKSIYGPKAKFRAGQREAIEAVLQGRRTLVVERTGWGKSLIYFMSTKILREQGHGPCLIVSPLLALINNQTEAAARFGLQARTINSETSDQWEEIYDELSRDQVDILFISPERLSNTDFMTRTLDMIQGHIGLLVVDEAHCISDWGHDFRPDYMRIIKVIRLLPPKVPLLATTATANNRVVEDIRHQFGQDLFILRGPLARETLHIQVLSALREKSERMAWLAAHLNELPGTGIIYCLTTGDCENVSRWLRYKGLAVEAYYSRNMDKERKAQLLEDFLHNRVKALVATVALGMGIDKPDIGFVIHFQMPGNLIAYYQQIGRAGRAGQDAYAILMHGEEDERISEYFIQSAHPAAEKMEQVVTVLDEADDGLKTSEILDKLNLPTKKVEQILKLLQIDDMVYKTGAKYYRSARKWYSDEEHVRQLMRMRQSELREMREFVHCHDCYMERVTKALDDPNAHPCGKCGNCSPESRLSEKVLPGQAQEAAYFLKQFHFKIEPRKKWPDNKGIKSEEQLQVGYALSNYGDAGWGHLVQEGKYQQHQFSQQLIDASVDFLTPLCKEWKISVVTAVPSLRHPHLVPDFAKAVAEKLGLPYVDALKKCKNSPEQKLQNNSAWQYRNAFDSFEVGIPCSGNVLLIDDMVDSRWTLTVCGIKLLRAGASKVYPFALANSGSRG